MPGARASSAWSESLMLLRITVIKVLRDHMVSSHWEQQPHSLVLGQSKNRHPPHTSCHIGAYRERVGLSRRAPGWEWGSGCSSRRPLQGWQRWEMGSCCATSPLWPQTLKGIR